MSITKQEQDDLSRNVSPIAVLDVRDYLQHVYEWLKKRRPSYSYIEFAADLGFSATNVLHLMIRGRRPVTAKAGARIADALGLKGRDNEYFSALVAYGHERDQRKRDDLLKTLLRLRESVQSSPTGKYLMEYLAEWYNPVIREMCFLPEFVSDGAWIADHILPRIRPEQARRSLVLLERLGLIKYDEALGRHVPVTQTVSSGNEVDDLAVVRYHHAMIDLGKKSISTVDEGDRDIGAITFCADEKVAAQIKTEVQAFRKKILALAENSSKRGGGVYQMNVQYFPVSRKVKGTADDK